MKAKVAGQEFLLQSSHIAEALGVPSEYDSSYFDNVRTSIFLENYISEDELVGTALVQETRFNNPVKAMELTKMAFIFWQIFTSNILPHKWGVSMSYRPMLYIVGDHHQEEDQLLNSYPQSHVPVPQSKKSMLVIWRLLTSLLLRA